MSSMNILLFAAVIAASGVASPEYAGASQIVGTEADAAVVARVDGEAVTRAELERMRTNPLTRLRLQQELGVANPDPEQLERAAMQRLIHRRLMLAEASRRNIAVSDDELDAAIAGLRRRFDDLEGFGAWMKEQGLGDRSLFETVRADLLTDRVLASLVEGVRIGADEALQYYEAHPHDVIVGEEVRLRIIAVHDEASAGEILTALRQGATFGRLARQRSLGLRAAQGGDTSWVDFRTLSPPLREAVALMKAGDVGGPVKKGPGELLVVGLEGRRPVRAKTLAQARPEIERRLLAAKQQEVVQAWLTEQEAKSQIEVFTEVISHATRRD